MKKRKHHYIWQFYLDAWSSKGKLWCLRESVFPSSTLNVAQSRDFYRLQRLTEGEKKYIRFMIGNSFPRDMFGLHSDILARHTRPFRLEDKLKELGVLDEEAQSLVDKLINDTEEDFHSEIEGGKAQDCLKMLRLGDISFWENNSLRLVFLHFLALQYFRTKKMQDKIFEANSGFLKHEAAARLDIDLARMWGVTRQMVALNVTKSLYYDRSYSLVLLDNVSDVSFIAGDSAALNTCAFNGAEANRLEFYYPVSPRFAVLVTNNRGGCERDVVGGEEVEKYNRMMLDHAHEFVFSNNKRQLDNYRDYFVQDRVS